MGEPPVVVHHAGTVRVAEGPFCSEPAKRSTTPWSFGWRGRHGRLSHVRHCPTMSCLASCLNAQWAHLAGDCIESWRAIASGWCANDVDMAVFVRIIHMLGVLVPASVAAGCCADGVMSVGGSRGVAHKEEVLRVSENLSAEWGVPRVQCSGKCQDVFLGPEASEQCWAGQVARGRVCHQAASWGHTSHSRLRFAGREDGGMRAARAAQH